MAVVAVLTAVVVAPIVRAGEHPSDKRAVPALHGGAAVVTIEIPEVGCASCSIAARKAIKSAGGVQKLEGGDPKNRLVVTYEPAPGRPGVYAEALHKAGFAAAREVTSN